MMLQHDVGYFENSTYCTDSFQSMVENAFANGYTRLNAAQFKQQKQLEYAKKRAQQAKTPPAPSSQATREPADARASQTATPASLIRLSDAPDEHDLQAIAHIKGGSMLQLSPGLKRASRRRELARTPKALGSVWQKLVNKNGWQASLDEGYLRGHFAEIVGGPIASHCQIESIQDDTLVLRCTSTAWAKALQMEQAALLKNIDAATGAITIKRLIILGPASPSWKYGIKSVPGRGPRDTYG